MRSCTATGVHWPCPRSRRNEMIARMPRVPADAAAAAAVAAATSSGTTTGLGEKKQIRHNNHSCSTTTSTPSTQQSSCSFNSNVVAFASSRHHYYYYRAAAPSVVSLIKTSEAKRATNSIFSGYEQRKQVERWSCFQTPEEETTSLWLTPRPLSNTLKMKKNMSLPIACFPSRILRQ